MERLKPNFEIYDFNNFFLVRYFRPQETGPRRHVANSMEDALKFIQSFYVKDREQRTFDFKQGDSSKPRHPYDRDPEYWISQEEEDKLREEQDV